MATKGSEAWLGRRVIASEPSPPEAAQLDSRAPGAAAGALSFYVAESAAHFRRRRIRRSALADRSQELAPLICGSLIPPDSTYHLVRIVSYLPSAISAFSAARIGFAIPFPFG